MLIIIIISFETKRSIRIIGWPINVEKKYYYLNRIYMKFVRIKKKNNNNNNNKQQISENSCKTGKYH